MVGSYNEGTYPLSTKPYTQLIGGQADGATESREVKSWILAYFEIVGYNVGAEGWPR